MLCAQQCKSAIVKDLDSCATVHTTMSAIELEAAMELLAAFIPQ